MLHRAVRITIRAYQLLISPLLGPRCRFWPSCSHYLLQAIETHGLATGMHLGARRLLRCHPWSDGGVDPVPALPPNAGNSLFICTRCAHGDDAPSRRAWPDVLHDGSLKD
jgi:uncharacterized protein